MEVIRKTLCATCLKNNVCKFADNFLKLVEDIEDLNTEHIHNVEVTCAEYVERNIMR